MDRHFSSEAFDKLHIALIIKGGKRLFLKQKATRLSITKDILEMINQNSLIDLYKLNIDTAFKVVWANFLRLEKTTYIGTELKKVLFLRTKITRFDVSFSKENQYIVLCLKQNKTDSKHIGTQIIFMATGEKIYLIAVLTHLSTLDLWPTNATLFYLLSNTFLHFSVMIALKKRISLAGLAPSNYSGHSFHKGAA